LTFLFIGLSSRSISDSFVNFLWIGAGGAGSGFQGEVIGSSFPTPFPLIAGTGSNIPLLLLGILLKISSVFHFKASGLFF